MNDLAKAQTSPKEVVKAVNNLLSQAIFLSLHYAALTGNRLVGDIPESVSEPLDAGSTDVYAGPRADGAVRSREFDAFVEEKLGSSDPVEQAWARGAAAKPWYFTQDTLSHPGLTEDQKNAIILNTNESRFWNGMMGGPWEARKYGAWKASPIGSDEHGPRLEDAEITDAFATSSDLVVDGKVEWAGLRNKDMGEFARRSLAHYALTSGGAIRAGNGPLPGTNPAPAPRRGR